MEVTCTDPSRTLLIRIADSCPCTQVWRGGRLQCAASGRAMRLFQPRV
jgi:hypothetical protein